MEPTIPQDQLTQTPAAESQETLDKSNVQKRIDELTAARYAAEKAASEAQAQLAQTTAALAARLAAENAAAQQKVAPEATLPDDATPAQVAKFFTERMERMQKEQEQRTQQMYWQMQNQMDQQQVAAKFAHLPEQVRLDAANRLTALKQRYGDAATMEDAVAIAFYKAAQVNGAQQRQNQFNQMGQPMAPHGTFAPVITDGSQQSTNLASPASRADWDSLDLATQNKLITEWEKKGGRLM